MADLDVTSQITRVAQTITNVVEQKLDAEIEQLDNLKADDLEAIRQARIQELKDRQAKLQQWRQAGHGEFTEISTQQEFFAVNKASECVVCHFYSDTNAFCPVIDKHLALLARKHMEARFVKIKAEKAPYLVENLNIWMMPTILLTKDNKTVDKVEGLDSIGGTEDFPTEALAWRIGLSGVIEYKGNYDPINHVVAKKKGIVKGRSIKGEKVQYDSSDDEW
jgi:hypothetical protein